jgi:hypothetical protein
MRGALAIVALVAGIGVIGFYAGMSNDSTADEKARGDTLERVLNADVGTGDAVDDGAWLDGFLRRNAD